MRQGLENATVLINGRSVFVEWTPAVTRALAMRQEPLFVELELYFSCLVKKFVHFRDDSRGRSTATATDKLHLYFRTVTSTACATDVVERLGRQPEIELNSDAVRKIAPKSVRIDHVNGEWRGVYSL